MNHCIVLDVDIIAQLDVMYVAAQYGAEPETTVITRFHIANDGSIFCDKAVLAQGWRFSAKRLYNGHYLY
jgi:hypothetical protein